MGATLAKHKGTAPRTDERLIYLAAAAVLLPALLCNLGLLAFLDDEGIRALVALEMQLSGNCIVPTLFGEPYLNKPPLYNWLLLGVFQLTGRADEWTARLPTVFFLLLYAGTVYACVRRHFPRSFALLNAFALITCGRILFWDSMLGLIDISFSWVVFLLFMWVYHRLQEGRLGALFAGAYALAAVAFLLKGLPAVVFLGTTLLVAALLQGRLRALFSWQHAVGALCFLLPVGLYYWAYARQAPLQPLLETLFHESAKRTAVQYGWWDTLRHFFTFPFEMVYHFLPWSLGALFLLDRRLLQRLRTHPFVHYCFWLFLATVLLYWTSVEVYPRYLLMHAPLIFLVFFHLLEQHRREGSRLHGVVQGLWKVLVVLLPLAALSPFVYEPYRAVPHWALKSLGLAALLLAACAVLYLRSPSTHTLTRRLPLLVLMLLLFRFWFDLFILPHRLHIVWNNHCRSTILRAARNLPPNPLLLYRESLGLQPATGFYFTRETGRILRKVQHRPQPDTLLIINPGYGIPFEKVDSFHTNFDRQPLFIGTFKGDE